MENFNILATICVAEQAGLSLTLSYIPKTGFLPSRPCSMIARAGFKLGPDRWEKFFSREIREK